ncbi:splicing factor U2AF large subunit [Plasmodium falciparum NF54]|uniref:Splicing factor U2AF large subunit, putative n=3 Tax=Plasmodium falciparum TaxID=5833 RepID=Q8IKE9_PLAF7|nr:splicing factor U2AF large subunit, putative [Plasmodium falciparum 3D7]EWC85328.1 hypothetical protein PFNF54_05805 [Plasmodium falciparum NF54]KAF4329344.1 splicing factor U2AF large subunit [Plasmodium falciparum NF54]PKC49664.1 splicing factor U2AF large subunit [Plasmodium falciparum NF54]CZU00385.1 splicing factor U2AF large subunit, putative [Plasmodium falciparum 3D7]|eukprot:XP_001348830.1 splicing factor U2AF large subunit, putative [Plasmodium falciparum 3D7]
MWKKLTSLKNSNCKSDVSNIEENDKKNVKKSDTQNEDSEKKSTGTSNGMLSIKKKDTNETDKTDEYNLDSNKKKKSFYQKKKTSNKEIEEPKDILKDDTKDVIVDDDTNIKENDNLKNEFISSNNKKKEKYEKDLECNEERIHNDKKMNHCHDKEQNEKENEDKESKQIDIKEVKNSIEKIKEKFGKNVDEKIRRNESLDKKKDAHSVKNKTGNRNSTSRSRSRNRNRSKDRYLNKRKTIEVHSNSEENKQEKRRTKSRERSIEYRKKSKDKWRDRSKEKSRQRSRDRSKERSRQRSRDRWRDRSRDRWGLDRRRSRYKDSRDRNKFSYHSRSISSDEEHYSKNKKRTKRRKSRHNIDKDSYSSSSNSTHRRRNRKSSSSNNTRKDDNNSIQKKRKKSKWDTVDECLLNNNLLNNSVSGIFQKSSLTVTGNLIAQNNKITDLSRNPYEQDTDKKQRKLYIGNIPPNSKQEDVVDFFNNSILAVIKDSSLDVKIGDVQLMPVIKCEIFNSDSRFCFLEFRTVQITWLCLKLDSIPYNNYCLRIGRPHDYIPPPEGDPAFTTVFTDINMDVFEKLRPSKPVNVKTSSDEENRLYIQNLPHDLKDEQIKDLLEQFGDLKAFNIIKDLNTGLNKGYGFFEYEDSSCTQLAIHALNGFVCGQNILNVKKATFNKQPTTITTNNNMNNQNPNFIALPNNSDVPVTLLPSSISQKILSNSIIGLQVQASRKIGEKSSKVVQLTNAVFQEDLIVDSQYEEILKEVKEEAEKYGTLQNIVIPKPNKDLSYTEGVGKIFLHYADEATARKAQYMFNGRLFEKRVVCAAFYSEEHFLKGKYVLS